MESLVGAQASRQSGVNKPRWCVCAAAHAYRKAHGKKEVGEICSLRNKRMGIHVRYSKSGRLGSGAGHSRGGCGIRAQKVHDAAAWGRGGRDRPRMVLQRRLVQAGLAVVRAVPHDSMHVAWANEGRGAGKGRGLACGLLVADADRNSRHLRGARVCERASALSHTVRRW